MDDESQGRTIKQFSQRINYKVIALIVGLLIIYRYYDMYLRDPDVFHYGDGAFMGLILVCAIASILVARKYKGSDMFTKAYLFLGLGFVAWFVGDIFFYYYWFVLVVFPYPSPGDFFFVLNYVFAILHLYLNTRYFRKRWNPLLKAIVIGIPILAVSSFTLFAYDAWGIHDDLAFDLAYGSMFVLGISLTFAFAVVGVIVFRDSVLKETWLLLAAGILLWAIADSIFTYLETLEAFTHDHPINTMWMAALMIIIYALYKHYKVL